MTYIKQVLTPVFQKLNEVDIEFSNDTCLIVEDLNNLIKPILSNVQIEYNNNPNDISLVQKYFLILELKNASDNFIDVINRRMPVQYLTMTIRPTLEAALKIVSKQPFESHLKTKFIQDKNVKRYYSQSSAYLHANYIIDKRNFYHSRLKTDDFKKVDLHLSIYIDSFLIILNYYGLLPNVDYQAMYNCIDNVYKFEYKIKPKE